MYRANSDQPIHGPHQEEITIVDEKEPEDASAALILIHGRGASAESILTLASELEGSERMHIAAPQAHNYTWYPYSFLMPVEKNEPGLSSGLQAIFDIIEDLNERGIPKEKIVILGFSQGACLASEYAARHPARYGGLIAFSGGLIGDVVNPENYTGSLDGTPYFIGCSDNDSHVPLERIQQSAEVMEKLGAAVTKKIYPGMGHTVNSDEMMHAQEIVNGVLNG